MNIFKVLPLFLCIPILSLSQSLTFERTDKGAWVKEDGEKVLFYQAATKSVDGKYGRANYIHPLYNVDGYELTEDFPKDHLHHRGIFWTWHQTIIGDKHIGDAWECKDFIWDVESFEKESGDEKSLTFSARTFWKSPEWKDANGELKPFVEEQAQITVFSTHENFRVIDFEISLKALENELKIGGSDDFKGYGGFSVRMKLPKDIQFTSSTGQVTPRTEQVQSGPWMNVSGSLANNKEKGGVLMINHTGNPMYPEKWILRKKESMQNPVFPGQEPVTISTSEPTILKYRLVMYTGDLSSETIEKLAADFN